MKIIAIANQKGGVGKTTTSVNLGACLAERGIEVIILDIDPQANATSGLGLAPDDHETIYDSLIEDRDVAELVRPTKYDHLSIIPCNMNLSGCEIELAKAGNHLVRLREVLTPFKEKNPTSADYLLIDCPPSLGVLMTSSLAAADELIVPLQCEYYGLEGLAKIVGLHEKIRDQVDASDLLLEGILMTMADIRNNLTTLVVNDVRRVFPEVTYKTIIPRNITLGEAPSHGESIIDYAPTCAGAHAYRNLAEEFLQRHGPGDLPPSPSLTYPYPVPPMEEGDPAPL